MLTEGWDCNTVTHIVGLRPFMSQLLCEQVVGRGLRRASYEVGEDGKLTEEVAKVFGVPFEVIPFKQSPIGPRPPHRSAITCMPYRKRLATRSDSRGWQSRGRPCKAEPVPGDTGDLGPDQEPAGGVRAASQHRTRPAAGEQQRHDASGPASRGRGGKRNPAKQTIRGSNELPPDTGAPSAAVGSDPAMATLGTFDRAEVRRG